MDVNYDEQKKGMEGRLVLWVVGLVHLPVGINIMTKCLSGSKQ